jgi:hypothetical protein
MVNRMVVKRSAMRHEPFQALVRACLLIDKGVYGVHRYSFQTGSHWEACKWRVLYADCVKDTLPLGHTPSKTAHRGVCIAVFDGSWQVV